MTACERHPMVLLVDDSDEAREMYAAYFSGVGCETEQASDGFAAFDKALKHRPDAIVMDLRMPRLDGWEAVRLLKNRVQTRDIPIVALTGDSDLDHLKLARNAGCDAVLLKPCPPDHVHSVILKLLGSAAESRTGARRV
jgi:two-component system, cell cycle response regulator DivK